MTLVDYGVIYMILFCNPSPKGHLILKFPCGVFKSSKKPTNCFSRISSKKRSNQKSSVRESK